jgi:hypothetical protein
MRDAVSMFAWGHLRRNCRVRAVVRYSPHRLLPRPTECRLLVALLLPICKQRAQPPQFPRLTSVDLANMMCCAATKGPHNLCNESAPKLLPGCFARFSSDRNLAKHRAGTAGRQPPTERWQDKRREVRGGRVAEERRHIKHFTRGAK